MSPAARRRNTWESRERPSADASTADVPEASEGAGRQTAPDETAATTRVELPWPHRVLHPNSRNHWAKRADIAKRTRQGAAWAAKAAGLTSIEADALAVTVTFHAPDNRRRDIDGMLSACKSQLDGLADVVGVDDSRWSLSIRKAEPRPPHGAVVVEISEAVA